MQLEVASYRGNQSRGVVQESKAAAERKGHSDSWLEQHFGSRLLWDHSLEMTLLVI